VSIEAIEDAYQRLHRTGPEWGENTLTNHGPMVAETLARRGRSSNVDGWLNNYVRRLEALPSRRGEISEQDWIGALGDPHRITDWIAHFTRQVAERPWRDVLGQWWPRLLPGVAAGTTHGVIRVGHVVRILLTGQHGPSALHELAHGLAFWAARYRPVPGAGAPTGGLSPQPALEALARVPDQTGTVAVRFGRLANLPGWPESVAALRPAADAHDARARLIDLISAATIRYLDNGQASPVLLVHTATAPNAVLHTLPALEEDLWVPSLNAVWAAVAAIDSAYAPHAATRSRQMVIPFHPDPVDWIFDEAVAHGDEHVIKFADTAVDVYNWSNNPAALAAATYAMRLLPKP